MNLNEVNIESLLFIVGFVIAFILLVLHWLGKARCTKIAKLYQDPNSTEVNGLLVKVKQLNQQDWPQYKMNKPGVEDELKSLIDKLTSQKKSAKTPKQEGLLDIIFLVNEEWLREKVLAETKINNLDAQLKALKDAQPTYSQSQEIKHQYYHRANSVYKQISNQAQSWQMGLNLYHQVRKEINEAQSAVSSASTMETLDMFSKNKGISVMSSMANSSASSEINDIKPALSRWISHMKTLEKETSDFSHNIQISDTTDLILDLAFDFAFDFSSIFSLMKLSSASDQLESLENKLRPLEYKISEACKHYEDLRVKFLSKLE